MMVFRKSNHADNTARQLETYEDPPRVSSITSLAGTKADKNTPWIPLDKITTRSQIREHFDEQGLKELAESFRVHGQQQACKVFWSEQAQAFIVVAGERRFRAAQMAGAETLKCDVMEGEPDAETVHELQLIENVQREDLNPIEEAKAYQRFIDEFGWKQQKIAERTGKSQPTISRALKLLKLPEDICSDLQVSNAPRTLADALVRLKTADEQRELLERHRRGEVTAEQAQQETSTRNGTTRAPAASKQVRVKKVDGIDLKATGKKRHTNTDYALAVLDWCEDLATNKKAVVDLGAVQTRIHGLLKKLGQSQEQYRPAA